jgi:DNA primase
LTKQVNYDKFNIAGQLWLGQYEFNDARCSGYHITESEDGIVLPIFSSLSKGIVGCQVRRYNKSPKYLTYSKQRYSYLDSTHILKPLVVVEDLLSSYKLHIAGFPTLCLLGTKMDDDAKKLLNRHEQVVLWLDDDVAGHSAANKLFRELSPLCPKMTAIMNYQPKELDMDVLKEMEL